MARTVERESRQGEAEVGFLAVAERHAALSRRRLLVRQAFRLALRLAFTAAFAICIGRWIMGMSPGGGLLATLAVLLAGTVGAGLLADIADAEGEAEVAGALRRHAGDRLAAMPARSVQAIPVGKLVSGLQRNPDALAALVIGHRAARTMMAIGPFAAAVTLVAVSWQAGLAVIAMTPVMIVFFVLVGEAIRTRAQERELAFGRLAGQFADRIRALPTILANHGVAGEAAKLDERLETHRVRTMGVLRIAFLNAGVIDFFSSLSIAILAVFLGLGHLGLATIPGFSGLDLWQSLFVLMVAPDYFAPFRRYAEQYHANADGLAAAAALDQLLSPAPSSEGPAVPAVPDLPQRGLVVLAGPSGSGKSTLLRSLAGLDGARSVLRRPISWIGVDAFVPAGTLADAIAWRARLRDEAWLLRAASMVGLLDDALLPGGLHAPVTLGGGNLSGGQKLRISLARALLAEGAVFADEPTSKLDGATAGLIRNALREMAATRLVVAASHDPVLLGMARWRIDLGHAASSLEFATP